MYLHMYAHAHACMHALHVCLFVFYTCVLHIHVCMSVCECEYACMFVCACNAVLVTVKKAKLRNFKFSKTEELIKRYFRCH